MRVLGAVVAAGLVVTSARTGALVTTVSAVDDLRGYDGPCAAADRSAGVTVVVDFADLGAHGDQDGETIVRCSPGEAGEKRTGLQALRDAGIAVSGIGPGGANKAFVCRLEGRPASDEKLLVGGEPYREKCEVTPPTSAYWAYHHSAGDGSWDYSTTGASGRYVTPGGFEGWVFALDAGSRPPKPGITPAYRDGSTSKIPTARIDVAAKQIEPGERTRLRWATTQATTVRARGAWNGIKPAVGSSAVAPAKPGTYTYKLLARNDAGTAKDTVVLRVRTDDEPGTDGGTGAQEPPGASAAAELAAAWLVRELDDGAMPGPATKADVGLTIDTLFALYAAGTGERAADAIVHRLRAGAGSYLGADNRDRRDVRVAGAVAKLLVAAEVAGKDPRAFGRDRFAASGGTYDLRAETLGVLQRRGAHAGSIRDRGTSSDSTNTFGQSFAVIGLARSGGVPRPAVDFLRDQQCTTGYFRMFFDGERGCDAANGSPDAEGTALAVQALMVARDSGVGGLEGAIGDGVAWLGRQQARNGSFGGGVGTGDANTNSTALAAQALAAAGRDVAARRAADWVERRQVGARVASATSLRGEVGAIAYDAAALATGRIDGLALNRDQWRRATSQGVAALAPVPIADLGGNLSGNPKPPDGTPVDGTPAAARPGSKGLRPGAPTSDGRLVRPVKSKVQDGSQTPAGRLGSYLASQLVDGNHVEVREGGATYVDYDLTADTVLALRTIGEQQRAADRTTDFLLTRRSIAAYAHGVPYEKNAAAYAEPFAKLSWVARMSPEADVDLVTDLTEELAALRQDDGTFADTGELADTTLSTRRQAWASLATSAAGDDAAAATVEPLQAARCADGTLPTMLYVDEACEAGDLAATGIAVQAIAAVPAPGGSMAAASTGATATNIAPVSWSADRVAAVVAAADALQGATGSDGRVVTGADGATTLVAQVASGRQSVGLDATASAALLGAAQLPDGGLPDAAGAKRSSFVDSVTSAPAVAGRSWLTAPDAPAVSGIRLPLAPEPEAVTAPEDVRVERPWAYVTTGAAIAVLVVAIMSLGRRLVRRHRLGSAR